MTCQVIYKYERNKQTKTKATYPPPFPSVLALYREGGEGMIFHSN